MRNSIRADAEAQTRQNDNMCIPIADHNLKPDDLPGPDADWQVISEFALTCNGYERREDLADFANAVGAAYRESDRLPEGPDLAAARDCLFFEQRASRQAFTEEPTDSEMVYIYALVEVIRSSVSPH